MKGPEENINLQADKALGTETDLETTLEIVLETLKTEIEGILRELIGLEINLEIILEIDQMIELEMAEMILDKNQADIVNIVIKMVTLGNIVGCSGFLVAPVNGHIGATSPGCAVLLVTLLTGVDDFLAGQQISVSFINSWL